MRDPNYRVIPFLAIPSAISFGALFFIAVIALGVDPVLSASLASVLSFIAAGPSIRKIKSEIFSNLYFSAWIVISFASFALTIETPYSLAGRGSLFAACCFACYSPMLMMLVASENADDT